MIKKIVKKIGYAFGFIKGVILAKLFIWSSARMCEACGTTNASLVDKLFEIMEEGEVLNRVE